MRFNKFVLSFLLVAAVAFVAASAVVARKRAAETMWISRVTTSVKLSVEYVGDEDVEVEVDEGEPSESSGAVENESRSPNFDDYATFVIITPSGRRYDAQRSSGSASVSFPEAFTLSNSKWEVGHYKWMCFVGDKAVGSGQFDYQPTDALADLSLTAFEFVQERQRLVQQRTSAVSRAQIGTGRNDEWIWTKVRAALASVDGLRDSTIDVAVDNSVVTLSGSVPEASQKEKAGIVVRSIEGVKSLRNMLIISQQ